MSTRIENLKTQITEAMGLAESMSGRQLPIEYVHAIEEVVGLIDRGKVRICEPKSDGTWETHVWLKQAILLYFKTQLVDEIPNGPFQWVDKIPIKKWTSEMGVRVVPPAVVRF